MRVQIVDSPAYTPPYDRSLGAALARAGAAGPYSWDAIAEQHLALYRQLASG